MGTLKSAFFVLAVAATAACSKADDNVTKGNTNQQAPAQATAAQVAPPAPAPAEPAKPAAQHVELQISSVANTMAFDKKEMTVPTGAEVHITFKNNSTMSTLPHNWVLIKPGTEASVAASGLKMGETAGYLDVRDKNMIEHTPFAKPGETVELTFTAPEPGTYPYICTVPGHYMMMKGVLTVTP